MAQNSQNQEDLRVRRTRKLLQHALMELTVERGFAPITVRDITGRAMVNRSTFYRHYLDKYDLLDQYMDEVYELLPSGNGDSAEGATEKHPGPIALLKHIESFSEFYRIMLGTDGDQHFTQRLRQNVVRRFRYLIANSGVPEAPGGPPIDLRLDYVSCAGVGVISWWLDNGRPCSAEQLAAWLSQLNTASAGLIFTPPKTG